MRLVLERESRGDDDNSAAREGPQPHAPAGPPSGVNPMVAGFLLNLAYDTALEEARRDTRPVLSEAV